MKVKEISITMSKTINLGGFESFQCKVTLTATLEAGEDPEVEYEVLRKNVYNKLQTQLIRVMP